MSLYILEAVKSWLVGCIPVVLFGKISEDAKFVYF